MTRQGVSWIELGRSLQTILEKGRGHPDVLRALGGSESHAMKELPWILGCSGGGDSVALVLWCWAHFSDCRRRMRIAHFHHNLRGEAADADFAFVENLAKSLHLDFVHDRAGPWESNPPEGDMRRLRMEFFRELTDRGGYVFTGHHLDDVIETQFMRLARGASSAGLAAPRPVERHGLNRTFLRPFLGLERAELHRALERAGIPYCEDHTNSDSQYFRNRVRSELIPVWKRVSPGNPVGGAGITRQWMEEDDRALSEWSESILNEARTSAKVIRLSPLRGLPRAVCRRLVHRWLNAILDETPFSHSGMERFLDQLVMAANSPEYNARLSCGEFHFIVISKSQAAIESMDVKEVLKAGPLEPGVTRLLPLKCELYFEITELNSRERREILAGMEDPGISCTLDYDALRREGFSDILWVRSWEEGDRYRPLGSPGVRKLQDCFTDRKIPEEERKQRPVVCIRESGAILWCPGLLPADTFKISEGSKSALRLTYRMTSTG